MAGTIADKLNKIIETKEDIKAALIEKGQPIDATTPFSEYPSKIRAIEGGGSIECNHVLIDMEEPITQNGTYYAEQYDADGFSSVKVDIQDPHTFTSKTFRTNGVKLASSYGASGFSSVDIQVPTGNCNHSFTTATFEENGTYEANSADYGYADGFSAVTVNVDTSCDHEFGNETFKENGIYEAGDFGYSGFSKVEVQVQPVLDYLPITENGVYYASHYNWDGFDRVEVDVEFTPKLQNKTVKVNNYTVSADPEYDGLGEVTVEIDMPPQPIIQPLQGDITSNGTYTADEYGLDGISRFTVNVPQPSCNKMITKNGEYNVRDYATVTVSVSNTPSVENVTGYEYNEYVDAGEIDSSTIYVITQNYEAGYSSYLEGQVYLGDNLLN